MNPRKSQQVFKITTRAAWDDARATGALFVLECARGDGDEIGADVDTDVHSARWLRMRDDLDR